MAKIYIANNQLQDGIIAAETISGNAAIMIESGGRLVVAQAGSNLRMPAIGVSVANGLSGTVVNYVTIGRLQVQSGMDVLYSGRVGAPLYVATAGNITATKPLATSIAQRIGIAASGGMYVFPDLTLQSGDAGVQSGA
jgi:hypothetical protein